MIDARFTSEVARFRQVLGRSRSTVFVQLFDFLLERSNDERAPKEVEIALAVFGKSGMNAGAAEPAVRVYVHRLRKRLDEFYRNMPGPRLHIPKGQYRILYSDVSAEAASSRSPWLASLRHHAHLFATMVLAIAAIVSMATWWFRGSQAGFDGEPRQIQKAEFWQPLARDTSPLVVVGDKFVLAEAEDHKNINRLILDPDIQSRSELGQYSQTDPDDFNKLYDFDLRYTSIETAMSAWGLFPLLNSLDGSRNFSEKIISSSRLRAANVKDNDIIYIGDFDSLGILSSPLFQSSRFKLEGKRVLVDKTTGKRYGSGGDISKREQHRRDYGYLARLPGPSGKHIFIIAGLGDWGVQSMAALVADATQINQLSQPRRKSNAFEALFEVRNSGSIVLRRTLLVSSPLSTTTLWADCINASSPRTGSGARSPWCE